MNGDRITSDQLLARGDDRVIIMDGAMGTMLRGQGVSGNLSELNLTDPERIAQIHRSYIQSGAELIGTNTFNSEAVASRGVNIYEINRAGAQIASRVATEEGLNFLPGDEGWKEEWGPRRAIVAGSLVATSRNAAVYEQIAKGLLDGGADALLLESIYDLAKAEAALTGIRKAIGTRTETAKRNCSRIGDSSNVKADGNNVAEDIPIMISVTIDMEGRILSGEDFRTVFARLKKYGIFSLGFNCSMGAEAMIPFASELAEFALRSSRSESAVSICPSAGLSNSDGRYPEDPEFWASCIGRMISGIENEQQAIFAGGCCGTTPEYIKALKDSCK